MEKHEEIIELLKRIEQNQQKALQIQEKHLALVQEQLERSSQNIAESIGMQRVALARQNEIRKLVLPIFFVLAVFLVYQLFKLPAF